MKKYRILSLLLAAVMIISIASGCKSRKDTPESSSSSSSSSSQAGSSSAVEAKDSVSTILPHMQKYVEEKKALNSDTVGWLQIPELAIDDVVVCNFESNQYYLRLNFEKQYDFNGLFYADRRSVFGSGSPDELGVNTCIYGHALTDEMDDDKFNVKFGPLHSLRDPEIAKTVPYLFFTTEKEDLAFEIFAVFTANSDTVAYNRNDADPDEFRKMVKEEILPRSIYNYDVELKDDDKFITLSTCIYTLPNGTQTHYPKTFYRYGVMGRLVKATDALKTEASFTPNENLVIDPDTYPR